MLAIAVVDPTVQASMEHNTDSEAVTKQLETVTVSAAPRWNIELASLKRIQSGTYDFGESKDDDAINKTAGKVTGVLSHLTINVANTSTDHAKGVKGLEATNEPVTFDVKISNQWRRQGASTPIANQPNSLQPLAWSIANGSNSWMAIFHKYPSDRSNTKEAETFNSRKKNDNASEWKMTQETKNGYIILHLTVSHLDQYYNPNNKDQQNGILNWASAGIDLVNPTKINNKNLADQYGSDLNLQQDVWDMNLQASSVSGIKAKSAPSDSSNQSIISDDETGVSIPLYVSGMDSKYNQSIEYGCAGWEWQDSQTRDSSCILFRQEGSSVHDGSDIAVRGQKVMLASHVSYTQNKTNLPVIRTRLMKIDSTVLEPYENASTWNRASLGDGKNIFSESTLAYGVKKDGKAWSSDTEQAKAGISDLNYYNSISEAKKHGEIVAILATSYNAAPYNSTWMEATKVLDVIFSDWTSKSKPDVKSSTRPPNILCKASCGHVKTWPQKPVSTPTTHQIRIGPIGLAKTNLTRQNSSNKSLRPDEWTAPHTRRQNGMTSKDMWAETQPTGITVTASTSWRKSPKSPKAQTKATGTKAPNKPTTSTTDNATWTGNWI